MSATICLRELEEIYMRWIIGEKKKDVFMRILLQECFILTMQKAIEKILLIILKLLFLPCHMLYPFLIMLNIENELRFIHD